MPRTGWDAEHVALLIFGEHAPTNPDQASTLAFARFLAQLRDELAGLVAEQVEVARAHGAEWADVGDALGITKQAAHKRYRPVATGQEPPRAHQPAKASGRA